jgi:hypothetical protein
MSAEKGNSKAWDDANQRVGGILTLLVGAFAVLGITQTEIGSILRNDSGGPPYVLSLIGAAVLCFIFSIFLNPWWLNWFFAAGVCLLSFACIPGIVWLIPTGGAQGTSQTSAIAVFALSIALACVALVVGLATFRRSGKAWFKEENTEDNTWADATWSWQPVLLIAGLFLFWSAVYGAIRLETQSQRQADAQIDATLTSSTKIDELNITIHADRVSTNEVVDVIVAAHPRGAKPSKSLTRCAEGNGCVTLAEVRIAPDANGGTKIDRKLEFPIHPASYDSVYVSADPCQLAKVLGANTSIATAMPTTSLSCHATSATVGIDP